MIQSSLNSLMTLSPYSNYERRGDNCKAIVANKQTTTTVILGLTSFTLPSLMPYSFNSNLTKFLQEETQNANTK